MEPIENIKQVLKEFVDASDRACVIVSASFLDQLLEDLLKSYLVENSKSDKDIFTSFGPLSSFSSKIKISYRLGLISQEEYNKIEIFRSIRNIFAHDIQNCTLKAVGIKERVERLIVEKELIPPKDIPITGSLGSHEIPLPKIEPMDISSHRDIFEKFIIYIMNNLAGRTFQAMEKRAESPKEFKYSYEPMQIVDRQLEDVLEKTEQLNAKLLSKGSEIIDTEKTKSIIRISKFVTEQIKKAIDEK